MARVRVETRFEASLLFALQIFFVMQQGDNPNGFSWRSKKGQTASIFDIATPEGPLTVVLCSKEEAETFALYRRIDQDLGKEILHVAVAAGFGRGSSYPSGAQVHDFPMYHKGRVRAEALESFWSASRETARLGQAVLIHCNQSFHRGPLCLTAIMIRAGCAKDEALDIIAEKRCIYAGHRVPYIDWPVAEQEDGHAEDVRECHTWLDSLFTDFEDAPVPGAADAIEQDDVGLFVDDADAPETDDTTALAIVDVAHPPAWNVPLWRCSSCDIAGKKLLQCWVCSQWDCRSCSYWCTHCPPGPWKYTICGRCYTEGGHLVRRGKIWWCHRCSYSV